MFSSLTTIICHQKNHSHSTWLTLRSYSNEFPSFFFFISLPPFFYQPLTTSIRSWVNKFLAFFFCMLYALKKIKRRTSKKLLWRKFYFVWDYIQNKFFWCLEWKLKFSQDINKQKNIKKTCVSKKFINVNSFVRSKNSYENFCYIHFVRLLWKINNKFLSTWENFMCRKMIEKKWILFILPLCFLIIPTLKLIIMKILWYKDKSNENSIN